MTGCLPLVIWACGIAVVHAQGVQPPAVDVPKPVVLPEDAVSRLGDLLGERAAFFQKQKFREGGRDYDYFAAEKLWRERRPLLDTMDRQLLAARVAQNRAAQELERMRKQAIGIAGGRMGPAVATAEANLRDAQAATVKIQTRRDQVAKQLAPLEEYLTRARPTWLSLYSKLGRLVPRDATDPLAKILADAWKAAGAYEDSLVEAQVLGALAFIYAGDLGQAEEHLERASRFIRDQVLYELPVAVDCCHAWLLLGKPRMCTEFVAYLKSLPDTATTIGQDWAVGLHAYAERKLHEGAKHFIRAAGDAIDLRARLQEEAPPALWADAVVTLLQTDAGNANRGRSFFKKAGPMVVGDGGWQMLRARSMIAADAAEWGPAVALLVVCAKRAPGPVQPELADQLAAYRQQRAWNVRNWRKQAPPNQAAPPQPVPPAAMPAPQAGGDSDDPRYAYDGRFPESDFRGRFAALRNDTDATSVTRWRAMLRALFDSGLTLNDIDWAEQCRDDQDTRQAFTDDEAIKFQKFIAFTAEGW